MAVIRRNPSKFNNQKITIDGYKFDSRMEADYYLFLKDSPLKILEIQPKVYLTKAKILYKPDFKIKLVNGEIAFVDVKGFRTAVFQIKKRLWEFYGEEKLLIVKRKGKIFITEEEVLPSRLSQD